MTPHDTSEAVENVEANLALLGCQEAAAMLRRLHQRAADADREASTARLNAAKFHTLACEHKAALATARSDALREAAEIAYGMVSNSTHPHRKAKDDCAAFIGGAILALIPPEKPHDR